jgi:hypothetical protein
VADELPEGQGTYIGAFFGRGRNPCGREVIIDELRIKTEQKETVVCETIRSVLFQNLKKGERGK